MALAFLAVEGPQDVEFVAGLLEAETFFKVRREEELAEYCHALVPGKFPHEGDLYARVPLPLFLRRNNDDWVAVQAAGGDSKLAELVRKQMLLLQTFPGALAAVGVIRDVDGRSPTDQIEGLLHEMESIRQLPGYAIEFPKQPGEIVAGSPRVGIYVLPDNEAAGTLDDVLLECGDVVYPSLLADARIFVDRVDLAPLTEKDKELFLKPAGRKKATVACAANVLKPGMSIAVSIDQNRWLNEQTLSLPRVTALAAFLRSLLPHR